MPQQKQEPQAMAQRDPHTQPLRCLSIRQPWAWLVCIGAKQIENRTWTTNFRGTIAIHASTSQSRIRAAEKESDSGLIKMKDFPFGAIIGLADLVSIDLYGIEHESDTHACGPHCWRFENVRLLKKPIPMLGKLSLFKLTPAISEKVLLSETHTVDWKNDTRISTIVQEFQPEPAVASYYQYCIDELMEKGPASELPWMVQRLIEIDPDSMEAWESWNRIYGEHFFDRDKLERGVNQLAKLIIPTYGTDDAAWKKVYLDWMDSDDEEIQDADSYHDGDDPLEEDEDEEIDPIDEYFRLVDLLIQQSTHTFQLGKAADAIEIGKRLIAIAPHMSVSHFNVGYYYLESGQPASLALPHLELAWQLIQEADDKDEYYDIKPAMIAQLAKAYSELGKLDRAWKIIRRGYPEFNDNLALHLQATLVAKKRNDLKSVTFHSKEAQKLHDSHAKEREASKSKSKSS